MGCTRSEVIDNNKENEDYRLINKMKFNNLQVYSYKKACLLFKKLIAPIFCEENLLKNRINIDLTNTKCPFCNNVLLDQMKVEEIQKFRNKTFKYMYQLNLTIKLIEKDETIDIFENLKKNVEVLNKNKLYEKFFRIKCRNEECRKKFMLLVYEDITLNEYLKQNKNEKYILDNWENNQNVMEEIKKERNKNFKQKKLENQWEKYVFEKNKNKFDKLVNLFEDKLKNKEQTKMIEILDEIVCNIPEEMYYENKVKLLTYFKTGVDDLIAETFKYEIEKNSNEIEEKKQYFSTHNE